MPTDGDASGFVVRHIDADFLSTAKLGDSIKVETVLVKKKKASLILKQTVIHSENEKKVFQMDVTLVFVRNGKPSAIPEIFSDILK